jgi:hypothetical protein
MSKFDFKKYHVQVTLPTKQKKSGDKPKILPKHAQSTADKEAFNAGTARLSCQQILSKSGFT